MKKNPEREKKRRKTTEGDRAPEGPVCSLEGWWSQVSLVSLGWEDEVSGEWQGAQQPPGSPPMSSRSHHCTPAASCTDKEPELNPRALLLSRQSIRQAQEWTTSGPGGKPPEAPQAPFPLNPSVTAHHPWDKVQPPGRGSEAPAHLSSPTSHQVTPAARSHLCVCAHGCPGAVNVPPLPSPGAREAPGQSAQVWYRRPSLQSQSPLCLLNKCPYFLHIRPPRLCPLSAQHRAHTKYTFKRGKVQPGPVSLSPEEGRLGLRNK